MLFGSIPVLLVGLSRDYTSFLLFRLAIGVIGASFVITQFHMSLMFAAKVKGTAGAITGGWGNLGGGVTNMLMPVIFSAIVGFRVRAAYGVAVCDDRSGGDDVGDCVLVLPLYEGYAGREFFSRWDRGMETRTGIRAGWLAALADWRILALTAAYAVCFGMEITFDNVASLILCRQFSSEHRSRGVVGGCFRAMNLFARALGGIFRDKAGYRWGMRGKGLLLAGVLLLEGIALLAFARCRCPVAGDRLYVVVCVVPEDGQRGGIWDRAVHQ